MAPAPVSAPAPETAPPERRRPARRRATAIYGRELLRLEGRRLAMSADGTQLATFVGDAVMLWADDGRRLATLCRVPSASSAFALAFSPSGTQLVAGSYDSVLSVDIARRKVMFTSTLGGSVTALAFDPAGTQLVVGFGKSASVRSTVNGDPRHRLSHERGVASVAWSGDGRRIATCGGLLLRVWSTDDFELAWDASPGDGSVDVVAFSPDGRRVAAAGRSDPRLWDVRNGHEVLRLPHSLPVTALAFSTDGAYLATAADRLRLWGLRSRREVLSVPLPSKVTELAFGPGLDRLAVGSSTEGSVWELCQPDAARR